VRRWVVLLLSGLLLASSGGLSTAPVTAQAEREDARRGLVFEGLQRVAGSHACRGNFRVGTQSHRGIPVCTHGPDPAPEGVDVGAEPVPPVPAASAGTALATQVPCTGNGSDGSAASRSVFWYHVVAVNSAGEGPPSNLARMVAK